MDQTAAIEALPPVPSGKQEEGPQGLRATGSKGQEALTDQREMVPTMVPSGAEIGANRPALDAREAAPNCTEDATDEQARTFSINVENPEENATTHTSLQRSASPCTPNARGGTRTPTGDAHWILNPARLPIPPLSQTTRPARTSRRTMAALKHDMSLQTTGCGVTIALVWKS